MKSFFILVLCALLVSVVGCGDQTSQSPNEIGGSHKQFVVYDFWASWCGPCHAFAPTFEEWKTKYTRDNVAFKKVNVDEDKETAGKFNISALPTVVVTADGKEVGRFRGAPREHEVVNLLK
jgi:thioredoxin 1